MILYGPTPKSKENINSRACLPVAVALNAASKAIGDGTAGTAMAVPDFSE